MDRETSCDISRENQRLKMKNVQIRTSSLRQGTEPLSKSACKLIDVESMFGAITSLEITCLIISLRHYPKKGIIVTRKNIIDCFVIAEVSPIFLRDLAGNRGHLEG